MKKSIILSMLMFTLSFTSFAQKDINAWKSEQNLEQQYAVFKKNLAYWDGKYILNERQLNDFYSAFRDTVSSLENETVAKANKIDALQNELNATNSQLEDTKAELETSIKNQNAIEVMGMQLEKGVYTMFISLLILALLVALGVVYMLYKRSNKVTVNAKKDYEELKEEFEVHKKNALERYTKINTELHNTRMELNKR